MYINCLQKNSTTQTDISEDEIAKVYEISWSSSRSVTPDAGQSNFPGKRLTFHRNVIVPVAKGTRIQLEVFLLTTSSSAIRKLARAAGRVSAGTTRRKKKEKEDGGTTLEKGGNALLPWQVRLFAGWEGIKSWIERCRQSGPNHPVPIAPPLSSYLCREHKGPSLEFRSSTKRKEKTCRWLISTIRVYLRK